MQKILRKRVIRELRANLFRYAALGLLIIFGMYMIISLVGAAETVITGVDRHAEKNCLEDGQFAVFVPLTETERKDLEKKGISLEEMFYLDFTDKEGETLRIFQNRKQINLIELDEGRLAERKEEAVLEKRYCSEHDIAVGDSITLGGKIFEIVGIGSVPDYDAPYKKLSDSSVDSKSFGMVFLDEGAYKELKESGNSDQSEEYLYAYRLNGKMTDTELKDWLKKLECDVDEVEDEYFKEYWERTAGKKEDFEEGIRKLTKGAEDLSAALEDLTDYNSNLTAGAEQILDSYLAEAESGLAEVGLKQKLTADNYEQVLDVFKTNSDNAVLRLKISTVTAQLKKLKAYRDGITGYTDGVSLTAEGAGELAEGMQELKKATDELIDTYLDVKMGNLTQFLTAEDNPRIKASADDQIINKVAGLIAGIIVMVLFTYVISVFIIHNIEQESSIIGALYALGAKKKDLMLHYLMLPVIVTWIAGLIGTLIGFSKWGIQVQMGDCYNYYSVPELHTVYSAYLVIYGMIMPPIVAAAVNCFVIHKRLSQPALKLIKNEQKISRISNMNLGDMGFISKFRIRQMLREMRTGFTIIFGMFISLLIMMIGINCYVLCKHISVENKQDTKYAYMYTYKYPEEEVPEGGEACYAKTLKKEIFGYNLDITLLGIDSQNPYFDAEVTSGKNKVILSSAMAQKYGISAGEKVILTDEESEMDYVFTVEGVTQFSTGLYAFMDIDSMRELFGAGEEYYNVVFADYKLDIEAGKLYAVTSKEEISKSSDVFVSMMMPMIYVMTAASALIFCVVMYLMMKVMVDRSSFSISLVKIFGYRKREIQKLYLNGNFYIIAVGAAICIPLAKKTMDAMYPVLISNVACGMNLTFSWQLYLGIYLSVLLLYFVINRVLLLRLKKIVPAEVLKNRE